MHFSLKIACNQIYESKLCRLGSVLCNAKAVSHLEISLKSCLHLSPEPDQACRTQTREEIRHLFSFLRCIIREGQNTRCSPSRGLRASLWGPHTEEQMYASPVPNNAPRFFSSGGRMVWWRPRALESELGSDCNSCC